MVEYNGIQRGATFRGRGLSSDQSPTDTAIGSSCMRHVYICQEQAYLAHGRTTFNDNEAVIYLVDDRSLQRKLAKDGCLALCGDLRDGRIYQRAHITEEDDVLIQVNSPQLTQDIVQLLWH